MKRFIPVSTTKKHQIREAFERGDSLTSISKEFQIPRSQIYKFIYEERWERCNLI